MSQKGLKKSADLQQATTTPSEDVSPHDGALVPIY
jgi:hypothetical protein